MYDPSCHFSFDFFSFLFSFFVLWFRLSGTFDSWFDSLSTERLATILLSSVPLFVFHSFPPHRSPLCMQYNIPHVCFCFVFFVSKISYGSTMSLMSWNRMKKKKRGKSKSVPNNNYAVVALFILYFRGNFDLRSCRVQNKTKKY
jgi:hypothetical protein